MKHFILTYILAPDYLERREAFRAEHLALAQAAVARGELLLGGAARERGHAPDQAVLLFAGEDSSAAEAFARTDPYVTSGIVLRWEVREWLTVVGPQAASPVAV
jgi:uncharacterized protein YciI